MRDYEAGRAYYDAIRKGEPDVIWPGKPLYLAKTSGTTSGAKFIPITRDSIEWFEDVLTAWRDASSLGRQDGDRSA